MLAQRSWRGLRKTAKSEAALWRDSRRMFGSFRVQSRSNSEGFLDGAANTPDSRTCFGARHTIFAIAAMTGLRPSEVLGLSIDDLGFKQRLIFIRLSAWYRHLILPKSTRSVATMPMPGPLAEVLTNSGRGVQMKSGCRSQIRRAFQLPPVVRHRQQNNRPRG